jgi:hypothetical protein
VIIKKRLGDRDKADIQISLKRLANGRFVLFDEVKKRAGCELVGPDRAPRPVSNPQAGARRPRTRSR